MLQHPDWLSAIAQHSAGNWRQRESMRRFFSSDICRGAGEPGATRSGAPKKQSRDGSYCSTRRGSYAGIQRASANADDRRVAENSTNQLWLSKTIIRSQEPIEPFGFLHKNDTDGSRQTSRHACRSPRSMRHCPRPQAGCGKRFRWG